MFKLTLRQLAAFECVARLGSVAAAGRELGLSQSAVSMALKDLEGSLGADLFHRHRKKLTLNESGRRLQPRARNLLGQAREIEGQTTGDGLHGELDIAAGTTIGNYVIPPLCAAFMALHPGVRINLKVMHAANAVDAVDNMQCDVGLVEGPSIRPRFTVIEWRKDVQVVIAAPGHRFAGRTVAIADLKAENWYLPQLNTVGRSLFTKPAVDLVGHLNVTMETNGIEALKRAVAAGGGLSCVSLECVAAELRRGELARIDVRDLDLAQVFNIIMRKDIYQGELARAFVAFVQEQQQTAAAIPSSKRGAG
jgi:DNA-binding transcriptional LysR family regulator